MVREGTQIEGLASSWSRPAPRRVRVKLERRKAWSIAERNAMSLVAIVAALFVAAALGHVSGDVYAVERAATTEGTDLANIRIAKGKLSGKFNNRPLFEVLDAIRSKSASNIKVANVI